MPADRIETLNPSSMGADYPASQAVREAWQAVRNDWSGDRTNVTVRAGERSKRVVSVPTARLNDFLSELVRNPLVTSVEISR